MTGTKKNDTSEQLREALLDLERANSKERDLRLETETLLAGLNVLTNYHDRDKIFEKMLEVLRKLINFEDAFVLTSQKNELQIVASTSTKFSNMTWNLDGAMARLSIGKPLAFFDIATIADWQAQPATARIGVCSTMHVLLRDHPKMAILICTHPNRGFFVEKHLRLSTRFAPLASQALANLDSMVELEKINRQLQIETLERQKAQAQVIQNSKMAALGEMAGGVAHEINTPLAIIGMRVEQMEECVKEGDLEGIDFLNSLAVINKTVDRIAKIVNGLRFFARETPQGLTQKVKLSTLIQETLSFCQERFANHGVQFELITQNTFQSIELECRSVEISQVLLNLLNNAYDAIEENPEKWIRIDVSDTKDFVEISVTDSGRGIAKEFQDKIMQPFFTTKDIGKGTGLGLSISKGITDAHHGKLYLDKDSPNTRFVILLPKTQKPPRSDESAA